MATRFRIVWFCLIVAGLFAVSFSSDAVLASPFTSPIPTPQPSKLEPRLVERLQTIDATTTLRIGVWAAPLPDTPTEEQMWQEVVAQYPEAAKFKSARAIYIAELRTRVEIALQQILEDAVARRVAALQQVLESQGISGRPYGVENPLITTSMNKAQIEAIAASPIVESIVLNEYTSPPGDTSGYEWRLVPAKISPEAKAALQYVSEHEGIPLDDLMIGVDAPSWYPTIEKSYQRVWMVNRRPGRNEEYTLLVDLDTGEIFTGDEIAAIEQAERAASAAKYGKLEQGLYDYLQSRDDSDLVRVGIVVASLPGSPSEDELWAQAVALQSGISPGTKVSDIRDIAVLSAIEKAYRRLLVEALTPQVNTVLEELASEGIDARTEPDSPTIDARMNRAQIESLAASEQVSFIYLNDFVYAPAEEYTLHLHLPIVRW